MQCESFLIAVSEMGFLSLKEKINLVKAFKKTGGVDVKSGLDFFQAATCGQISRLAARDSNRPLRVPKWDGGELVRLARFSARLLRDLEIKFVLYGQKNYPPPLTQICDPPFALFYRGSMGSLFGKNVSVVGTRRLVPDARRAARAFAFDAACDGLCVVSGLALGADGAAHQGAIDAFFEGRTNVCKTAAVLAGGVDNVFPPSHKKIAAQIMQNGGVVLSECAPGIPAEKWRFVSRNRIIAALSPATVVIQAPPGSGAMLTADFALGYNRELFFHEACFSEAARKISDLAFRRLQAQKGAAARRKIEASPESYVSDGAKIVSGYAAFSEMLP